MKENRLFVVLFTLSVSTFYLFVPKTGTIGFPLNKTIVLAPDTWTWMLGEHLVQVGLSWALLLAEQVYLRSMAVLLAIQIVDTLSWVLNYDDPFKVVPFNMIKIIVFSFSIYKEMSWMKD